MNKRYILTAILITLNSLPIMAQELLNDIPVNDTLQVEHYCWEERADSIEWRTMLKNLKTNKKLEIMKITGRKRQRLRNKNFLQEFAASLFENKLYTLELSYGFVRINCLEFSAPNKFKGTTYAVDNYYLNTDAASPTCSGQILKVDSNIYFYVHISDVRNPDQPKIFGIYILKDNHTVLEKVKIAYDGADIEFTDSSSFISNITNERFVRSEVERIAKKYIELQDFEYLGFFTTIPQKVAYSPTWDFYHFLYKADGKIKLISYRIDNDSKTNTWLISKELSTEIIGDYE